MLILELFYGKKGILKYWLLENVPQTQKYIKERYTWEELGLPGSGPDLEIPIRECYVASDYNTPQKRKRFICGDYIKPKKVKCKNNVKKITESLYKK